MMVVCLQKLQPPQPLNNGGMCQSKSCVDEEEETLNVEQEEQVQRPLMLSPSEVRYQYHSVNSRPIL